MTRSPHLQLSKPAGEWAIQCPTRQHFYSRKDGRIVWVLEGDRAMRFRSRASAREYAIVYRNFFEDGVRLIRVEAP